MEAEQNKEYRVKKAVGAEGFVFIACFFTFFYLLSRVMGGVNMVNTLMNTAYQLLLDTVLYIMAIAVLTGALSGLLNEFGVISMINKLLSPLMMPVYGLPGASAVGIMTTYLSDNPAILTLANDDGFKRYFKKYQLPALTNIGTAFGMGLIITTFMMSIKSPTGESFVAAALIGNLGAIVGSIISTRLMIYQTAKVYGKTEMCETHNKGMEIDINQRIIRNGSVPSRCMESMLEGGRAGVDMGVAIIPGVLIICTLVMILTNPPAAGGIYTGAAYEGIGLLPWLGSKIQFIISPLFGFTSPECISVPITSLGAAGAAIGLVPKLIESGLAGARDVAVFTSMCMCWSGYLSTHVAMMDSLKSSHLTGKALISHTIGGFCAGIAANMFYSLFTMFM